MNRRTKRLAAIFMTLVMCLIAIPFQTITSYAASGKITFSDPSVTVGNQVTVNMKIASADSTALGASDVRLKYDSSALEFLSGTGANGGAGSIRVVGAMESADQTTFAFTLKFKALKAGTSSITVTSQEVYDANSQVMTMSHVGSSAVKINAPVTYSKDASLSSLTISPGELSPAFDKEVTAYTATVAGDVEKLTVSAPATDDGASVAVSGHEALQIGENTVTCKVTAEDGETTKTYTIVVTKQEGVPAESTDASAPVTSGGSAINVEEGNWQVAATLDASLVPAGFTITDYTYDGQPIQAAIDAKGTVLIFMTNEKGVSDFFLYDAEAGILAPYVTVQMVEKKIIVLSPREIPEGTEMPKNLKECTIDIGNHTVNGWILDSKTGETPEYCVVYGMNENGERNFYRYDQKEMTLQRYFEDSESSDIKEKYDNLAATYSNLLKDYKLSGYIIAGLIAVIIVLIVVLIAIFVVKKPKTKETDYDDDDEFEEFIPTKRRQAVATQEPKITSQSAADYDELEDLDFIEEEESNAVCHQRPVIKSTPAPVPPAPTPSDDDDFEFIDLDL